MILAEDEASLYLQPTLQTVWAPRGQTPVVRSDAGRSSTHFYGTLNLHTYQEIVTRMETMDAVASAQHLEDVLAAVPDVPILLFWDRAPWNRGQPIKDVLAANPRLEIEYFPVAAPDLNPQEHVWKATRREVSHNHSAPRLAELADKFEAHLVANTFPSSFLQRYGYDIICPMFN